MSGKLTNAVKELFTNPKHSMGAGALWALEQAQRHAPGLAAEAKALIHGTRNAIQNFTPVSAPVAVSSAAQMSFRTARDKQDECTIMGCEPIADVSWPHAVALDTLGGVIDINPATWVGTRAAAECMAFTRYQIENVVLRYVPRSGTQTPGVIAFGTISESPLDTNGTVINQLMASPGGFQTPIWSEFAKNIHMGKYGMANYPLDDFSAEPKSPIRIGWSTDLSAITSLGTLWAQYRIKLTIPRSPMVVYSSTPYRPYVVLDGQTPNLKHLVLKNGTSYWTSFDGNTFQGIVCYFNSSLPNWNGKVGTMIRIVPYQRVELLSAGGVYACTYRCYLGGEDVTELILASLADAAPLAILTRLYYRASTTAGTLAANGLLWSLIPGPLLQSEEEIALHVHFLRMAIQEQGGEAGMRAKLENSLKDKLLVRPATSSGPPPPFPTIQRWTNNS